MSRRDREVREGHGEQLMLKGLKGAELYERVMTLDSGGMQPMMTEKRSSALTGPGRSSLGTPGLNQVLVPALYDRRTRRSASNVDCPVQKQLSPPTTELLLVYRLADIFHLSKHEIADLMSDRFQPDHIYRP